MNGEVLYYDTPYFRAFPEPSTVFADEVQMHVEFLLPLASVDLSHFSKDWSGWVHFVAPIEPAEGLAGEGADGFYTYHCRPNWLGYRIIDGRYKLETDFRFFAKHRNATPDLAAPPKKSDHSLATHYWHMRNGFRAQKERFRRYGYLVHAWAKPRFFGGYSKKDRQPLVQNLGGICGEGNWANLNKFPLAPTDIWTDTAGQEWRTACPLTEDGRRFTYLGTISINEYVCPSPDARGMDADLLLFYDEVNQVALTTCDFS